jgi:hypothetical protein
MKVRIYTIYTPFATNRQNQYEHDEKVNLAFKHLEDKDCHYMSHTTVMLSNSCLRTEITYREDIVVRKVLIEKNDRH